MKRRYYPRDLIPRPCVLCGVVFSATRTDAVYCDHACKQKAWRLANRRKERQAKIDAHHLVADLAGDGEQLDQVEGE